MDETKTSRPGTKSSMYGVMFLVEKQVEQTATVSKEGAILLGDLFEIDGFASRPVRVITHFHSDHLIGINKSKKHATFLIATKATLESLKLLGYKLPDDKLMPLHYNKPLQVTDEKITLVPSKHVFGSAQVLVETSDGKRVGYTGDFKFPGTKIMKELDILVIDATYGREYMRRPFKNEIEDILTGIVMDALSWGRPVRILGYYGKLQEVMELLRKNDVTAPYVMPEKIYELTKIAIKHGMEINDIHKENTDEAQEIMDSGWFIYFQHMNSRKRLPLPAIDVYLSGWLFTAPARKVINGAYTQSWWVAFSDHGDFEDTVEYVKKATPRLLVVDSYRTDIKTAKEFASYINKNLGIKTMVLPGVKGEIFRED